MNDVIDKAPSDDAPPDNRATEPATTASVCGYRITERDVTETLRDLGDEAVADYAEGRMTRDEALRLTANRIRDLIGIGLVRVGDVWVREEWLLRRW